MEVKVPETPVFSCVESIDRLAGDHDKEEVVKRLESSTDSLCILFKTKTIATTLIDDKTRLLYRPLHEIRQFIDLTTLTFLGIEKQGQKGIFVAQVLPTFEETPSIVWLEVVPAATKLQREEAAIAGYSKSMMRQNINAKFCATCGTLTEPRTGATHRFCKTCKVDIFSRNDPVSIVLVIHPTDKKKCLLVRKPIYQPRTRHTCVAGFLEPGESAESGAAREVLEETGIQLDLSTIKFIASQPWPSDMGGQLMIGFQANAENDTIKLDKTELDDANWYTVDQVRDGLSGVPNDVLAIPGPHTLAHFMLKQWLASFTK